MANWKDKFVFGHRNGRKELPPGEFRFYTCQVKADKAEELVFSRHLDDHETKKVTGIVNDWLSNSRYTTETDMVNYVFTPFQFNGGILIIKIKLEGKSIKKRQAHYESIWSSSRPSIDLKKINCYEILYFQEYPQEDSTPFCWDLSTFEKQHISLYYKGSSWLKVPVSSDLFTVLKTEALKKSSESVKFEGRTYYFNTRNGQKVCYYYENEIRLRFSFTRKYRSPINPGKKYVWLVNMPDCGPVGSAFHCDH